MDAVKRYDHYYETQMESISSSNVKTEQEKIVEKMK